MNKIYLDKYNELVNNDSFKKKLITYLICVSIASAFWFLNSLSKQYSTSIEYPIVYSNFPKDKVLMGKLTNYIKIEVRGSGFTLLKYKIKSLQVPVTFDVNSFRINKTKKVSEYYILTKNTTEFFQKQIDSDLRIVSIKPDTLLFNLQKIAFKKVPVVANVSIDFKKQFTLKNKIQLIPDSIGISGPYIFVEKVDSVLTSFVEYDKIQQSFERNLKLKKLTNIKFDKKRVNIKVDVEKFTEAKISIPIDIINLPDSLNMEIYPQTIEITYRVGLSNYNKVENFDFKAIADFSQNTDLINTLMVVLNSTPNYIYNVEYSPKRVKYIISNIKVEQ